MKMIKNIKWLAFVAIAFVACNSDDDVVADPWKHYSGFAGINQKIHFDQQKRNFDD